VGHIGLEQEVDDTILRKRGGIEQGSNDTSGNHAGCIIKLWGVDNCGGNEEVDVTSLRDNNNTVGERRRRLNMPLTLKIKMLDRLMERNIEEMLELRFKKENKEFKIKLRNM